MFATHRLADADSLYRTGIDATGKIIIDCPHFAKFAGQHLQRLHAQLFPVVNPQGVHLLRRYRSHSPETFNGQPGNKVQCLGRMYGAKPIRLAVVRGYLGKKLIIGYAGGSHQIQPLPHLPLYLLRDVYSQWNARFILRHIQKSLVQRNGLDDIRIFMKDFVYLAGHRFIDIHPSGNKCELRA